VDSAADHRRDERPRPFFLARLGELLAYARHEARLNQRTEDGATRRAYLERSAARGNPASIAALRGPEYPEELEYLLGWAQQLLGRSGVGMDGAAPLGYSTVADWSRLAGIDIEPHEVDALMALDAVMRHPAEDEPEKDAEPAPIPVWPKRKVTDV
jgi:hypothetical protein